MQRGGSRGGYSKKAVLEAEILHVQLSNAELIKRLKVAAPRAQLRVPRPAVRAPAHGPLPAPAQDVTQTLEAYSDDDADIDQAKAGEQSCARRAPPLRCPPPSASFLLALRCAGLVCASSRAMRTRGAPPETGYLSSCLGEDWLLEHKNKDVRLLVACALADVLRIYAPDPPYGEETNADVIKLFIKILRGFQSPDMTPMHPSYRCSLFGPFLARGARGLRRGKRAFSRALRRPVVS